MMELFKTLGDEIEVAWRGSDYDEARLPDIAKARLIEHDLPSKVSPWEVIAWALEQHELPQQQDPTASFGEPPITVYSSGRFYIDVYFWFTSTTATHQHGFSGAFQVLAGSSIHSWYEFELEDPVNASMQFGRMSLKLCELLKVGDVQPILAGRQYIHSLFHLEEPSVTIVVRTKKSPLFLPQYSYEKPYLAIDPFFSQDTITKKVQAISALLRAKRPDADEMISSLLERSDIHSTFILLSNIRPMLRSGSVGSMFNIDTVGDRYDRFMEIAVRRHGERAVKLGEVFRRFDRNAAIINRRAYVSDPDLRFFLAVMLNVDTRDDVFSLIAERFPDADPKEKILDWTFDLANIRVMGLNPPNALGIEAFDDTDVFILEHMLNGFTLEEVGLALANVGLGSDDLPGRSAKLKNSILLSPLFA